MCWQHPPLYELAWVLMFPVSSQNRIQQRDHNSRVLGCKTDKFFFRRSFLKFSKVSSSFLVKFLTHTYKVSLWKRPTQALWLQPDIGDMTVDIEWVSDSHNLCTLCERCVTHAGIDREVCGVGVGWGVHPYIR